jgi:hypothetical protein
MIGRHSLTRPRRTAIRQASAVVAVLLGLATACSDSSPPTSPGRVAPHSALFSATDMTTTPILWNQDGIVSSHGHAMGQFQHAADFTVPPGTEWVVSQFMLVGDNPTNFVNNQLIWIPVTIEIRADNGGTPGSIIQTYSLTPIDTESVGCTTFCRTRDNLYQLPATLTLGPGTYWIAVSEPPEWQFTWYTSSPVRGGDAQFSADGGATWVGESEDGEDFDFAVYGIDGTPADNAQNLQATLAGLGLANGSFTSLNTKLSAALDAIKNGNTAAACSALTDFMNEVNAQTGKKLTQAQAATLISAATSLRSQLGC